MKKIINIAMALAVTLSITGCSVPDMSNSATSATPSELKDVTLMLDWTANTNHTGIYVAKAKGYYEAAGINLNIIEASADGAEIATANGTADFGISFQDYLVPCFSAPEEERLPITAVAAILEHNTSGIISLAEKNIRSPKDMAGHNYATWEMPIEQAIIKEVVTEDKGNYDDIELIPTYVENIVAALTTDIDTVWIYYGWDGIASELAGLDTNFFYFKDYGFALDYYSPVIIANNDFMNNNPDVVRAFLSATKKGYEYAVNDPDGAAEILVAENEGLDPEIVKKSQEWMQDKYTVYEGKWGYINQFRWDSFYKWVYDNKLCEVEIPSGYGFTNAYLE